jgi:hypothetical protein
MPVIVAGRAADSVDPNGPTGGPRAQERAMTTKADFTEEEWAQLQRAPFVAGMAISLADPGGPIEALKESMAVIKTVQETAGGAGGPELVDAVAKEVVEKARQRQNPLRDFRPKGALAGEEILEDLGATNRLVTEKATEEEAAAFREWLLEAAQRTADAAKEGGFMGFRAERVSEGEQRMLDKLRGVLSAPAG